MPDSRLDAVEHDDSPDFTGNQMEDSKGCKDIQDIDQRNRCDEPVQAQKLPVFDPSQLLVGVPDAA